MDPHPDHETLVRLTTQIEQHADQLQVLTAHDRDMLVMVTRFDGNITALQTSHEAIQTALTALKAQQEEDREDSHQQFRDLDNKISLGNLELRDHFDEKIDSWQAALDSRLQEEKDALPQWAKVRLMKWSVAVAIVAVAASVLEFLHVL